MFFTAVKGSSLYRVAVMGNQVIVEEEFELSDGRYPVFCACAGGTDMVEVGSFVVINGRIGPFQDLEVSAQDTSLREELNASLNRLEAEMNEILGKGVAYSAAEQADVCASIHEHVCELRDITLPQLVELLVGPKVEHEHRGYKNTNQILKDIDRIERLVKDWEESFD